MKFNIDEKEIRKSRTKATATTILSLVEKIDIDVLIESLFIKTEDEFTKKMIKEYEKQLILAKLKPQEFARDLNSFYSNMARYIKKNNLLKNFLLFYYIIFKTQNKNNNQNDLIYKLYMNIIPQQIDYLGKNQMLLCGVDNMGKTIEVKDPYPYIEYPIHILKKNNKQVTFDTLKKEYKKFGYDIKDKNDITILFNEYSFISNSTILNSFLINENTVDMVSFNPLQLSYSLEIPTYKIQYDIHNYLNQRCRFLKNGEIEVTLNAGKIKKIILKEIFLEDNIFLLYKLINSNNQSFTGFYDLKDDFFVSPYTEYVEYKEIHESIKNIVLETYIINTTDIDKNNTKFYDLNMCISEDVKRDITEIRKIYKKYNKDNLLAVSSEVNSYIRKLPKGSYASEEAKENARKYGIQLKEGETFVKSFEKTVYKKIK